MSRILDNSDVMAFLFFLGATIAMFAEIFPLALMLFVWGAITYYAGLVDKQFAELIRRIERLENGRR
jgi:hypothetical protein